MVNRRSGGRWIAWALTAGVVVGGPAALQASSGQGPMRRAVEPGTRQAVFAFSEGHGRAIRAEAEYLMPAPQDVVWRVLTDYDHLAEFVPFLTESHLADAAPAHRLLRQRGRVRFLLFSQRFTVIFRVTEQPKQEITFQAAAGDFKQFAGNWHVEPRGEEALVRYTVELEPAFFVPRWLLRAVERRIMLQSVEAIVQRCLAVNRHAQP